MVRAIIALQTKLDHALPNSARGFRKTRQSLISAHQQLNATGAFPAAGSRYFCSTRELGSKLKVSIVSTAQKVKIGKAELCS